MELVDWRPKRSHGALAMATPKEQALQSARAERWPPATRLSLFRCLWQTGREPDGGHLHRRRGRSFTCLSLKLIAAGLPISDRTGHSDPYVVVQVRVNSVKPVASARCLGSRAAKRRPRLDAHFELVLLLLGGAQHGRSRLQPGSGAAGKLTRPLFGSFRGGAGAVASQFRSR